MDTVFLGYICEILAETNSGLTGTKIIKYCSNYALKYDVNIPVTSVEMLKTTYKPQIPNKRTALFRNLLAFSEDQQIQIVKELCDLPEFKDNKEVEELKIKLNTKYQNEFDQYLIEQMEDTEESLRRYDSPLKLYESAIDKYNKGIYQRNILDDMRLALELLLKEMLGNQKSLENQMPELGKLLKNKGISNEVRNLFDKVFDFYTKYQNNYVKHNDNINSYEMEFIINQTNSIIKFLIKMTNIV